MNPPAFTIPWMKCFLLLGLAFVTGMGATPFDATRLQTGRFVYRDMQDGKQIATFTLTVHRQTDGTYRFTGDAEGFNQHWESIATAAFVPISAGLTLQQSSGRVYSMKLRYADGQVSGVIAEKPAPTDASSPPPTATEKSTHAKISPDTVDQRIDWAAMLSSQLKPGEQLDFTVYDPDTGLTPVRGRASATKTVTVPAGTYEILPLTYQMKKSTGMESYEIQVTPGIPRLMIREEFPDGVVTELIEATPEASSVPMQLGHKTE